MKWNIYKQRAGDGDKIATSPSSSLSLSFCFYTTRVDGATRPALEHSRSSSATSSWTLLTSVRFRERMPSMDVLIISLVWVSISQSDSDFAEENSPKAAVSFCLGWPDRNDSSTPICTLSRRSSNRSRCSSTSLSFLSMPAALMRSLESRLGFRCGVDKPLADEAECVDRVGEGVLSAQASPAGCTWVPPMSLGCPLTRPPPSFSCLWQ
ncbi:uncharacterized protein BJ171DRAFT_497666 [Polychytrium aggregatum]|uniref:uncharacterized protein n=1 Tax=Polychytrium aggregatum TaxID=110093 RepID=UPI0022FEC3E5|nr:uncharacterized protein BJ171DRAFT_497666 [Polychytrium aggregatum]KAI9206408.1 hypothetical protein BJ171DRAFT_497666 [Polychytrium aggregatum]